MVGLAAIAAIILLGPILADRLLGAGDGGRPAYWASASRMFQDAPIAGLGPGNYAARRVAFLQPGELDYTVPHAHDIYLQTAAELGILGLLAGAVAAAAVLWLIWRSVRSRDHSRQTWAWATLFGLVYLVLVDVVDFYANLPGVVLLWVVPLAMLDGKTKHGLGLPTWARPRVVGRAAVTFLVLGCGLSLGLLAVAELSATSSDRAVALADAGDWTAAAVQAKETRSIDPAQPAHSLTAGVAAMHLGRWQLALDALRESVAVDDLPQSWLGLAMSTIESGGSAEQAAAYLDAAMRIGRQHAAISRAAGELYDRLGLTAQADDAYADALRALPELAGDPFWREDPALRGRFGGLVETAIERSGSGGWRLALMVDDVEKARAVAGAAGTASPLVEDAISAWSGDGDALARIQALAEADPTDGGLLTLAGWLTAHAGDPDAANRFRRLALVTTEGVPTLGLDIHTAPTCDEGVRVATSADLFGPWAYRRRAPADLMPPGVRCLVFALGEVREQTSP